MLMRLKRMCGLIISLWVLMWFVRMRLLVVLCGWSIFLCRIFLLLRLEIVRLWCCLLLLLC